MRPSRPAGESQDGAARVGPPPRGAQAREGGHDVDPAGVRHALGQVLRLARVGDDAQLVAKPLHQRAGHKDGPLERILGAPRSRCAGDDGGHQVVRALARLVPGVQQHEAAGAVRVLCLTGFKAALAKERCLLVSGHARDGDARRDAGVARLAKEAGAGTDLGHHWRGDAKQVKELLVPAAAMDVVEHGAAGVGGVRRVDEAAREHPDKPRVHGAKEQLAGLGPLPRSGHVLKDPGDLACREVRIRQKARLGPHHLAHLGGSAHPLHQLGGAPALPHDGVADRGARRRVPHHGGLALVVYANGVYVLRPKPVPCQKLGQAPKLREENLLGIVLHPAGLGEYLLEGPLHAVDHTAAPVYEHGPRARGSLVKRYDALLSAHALPPPFPRCWSSQPQTSPKTRAWSFSFKISCRMPS